MKKKIIIVMGIVIITLLLSNVIVYAFFNKNLYQFYFGNDNNHQSITNNLLIKDNQKIEIDNYIITLEESLCEKNTQLGYLFFSIVDKNGNKVDASIDNYSKIIESFGKNQRFVFEYEATGTMNKYAEYVGNTLYVYISFEIDNNIFEEDKDLSDCIKITDTEEEYDNEYKQYNFNINFGENYKKFIFDQGIVYVSPLGLKIVTDNVMGNFNIRLYDKNDDVIKDISNDDNSFSKSGCNDNGVTKIQYTNQFDDLLDIKGIKNIYVNETKLEEVN